MQLGNFSRTLGFHFFFDFKQQKFSRGSISSPVHVRTLQSLPHMTPNFDLHVYNQCLDNFFN